LFEIDIGVDPNPDALSTLHKRHAMN